jgi:hypothetical protein
VIKRIIICIVVIFTVMDLFAMEVDLGGKAGLGIGWWRGEDYDKGVDVTGNIIATMGAYTSFEVHKHVALQFELLFAIVGNGDEVSYSSYKVTRSFRNIAFELPIYVKPKFGLGPGEMFFLAGPRLLVLLDDFHVDHKVSVSDVSYESESDYQIRRQFHLGISVGFGYEFRLGPGKMQLALNVTPYLTNYGEGYSDAIQNEAYLDIGYAYTFK